VKLKQRPADFKVHELLRDGVIGPKGEHCIYKVTKQKRTSFEAAQELADLVGVAPNKVSMAGLKDRQGVTDQYMSIPRGKPLEFHRPDLQIETVGFAKNELSSEDSAGNGFEIVVRDLGPREVRRLRESLPSVREHGLPNYFDEQRFGNLKHKQGWIALDLVRNNYEDGLKRLLTAVSDFDPRRDKAFKSGLYRHWGDWKTCRDIAGRFGQHHSIFEHLHKHNGDFAGAFRYVASRLRLIHLFAFQSHLFNRVAAAYLETEVDARKRFAVHIREGRLVFPRDEVPMRPEWNGNMMLTGAGLEGVEDHRQRALYEKVLRHWKLTPDEFRIENVPGFALKAEPRQFVIYPGDLRMRPAEPDRMHSGRKLVRMRFQLPRGAYATLVVRRLLGGTQDSEREAQGTHGRGRTLGRRGHAHEPRPEPRRHQGGGGGGGGRRGRRTPE
jgi:tRNA pseudouridine13 synthase